MFTMTTSEIERAEANGWFTWRKLPDKRILAVTVRAYNTILTIGYGFDTFDDSW